MKVSDGLVARHDGVKQFGSAQETVALSLTHHTVGPTTNLLVLKDENLLEATTVELGHC